MQSIDSRGRFIKRKATTSIAKKVVRREKTPASDVPSSLSARISLLDGSPFRVIGVVENPKACPEWTMKTAAS